MRAVTVVTAIIGFVQGYFGLTLIVGFGDHLLREAARIWKDDSLQATKYVSAILAYIFLVICFFGIAIIWINLFSMGVELIEIDIAKAWGKGWFVGLLAFYLFPIMERKFRKMKRK